MGLTINKSHSLSLEDFEEEGEECCEFTFSSSFNISTLLFGPIQCNGSIIQTIETFCFTCLIFSLRLGLDEENE